MSEPVVGLDFVAPMNMNELYTAPFAAAQWNAAAAYGYPQQYQQYAAFGAAPMMDMALAGRADICEESDPRINYHFIKLPTVYNKLP